MKVCDPDGNQCYQKWTKEIPENIPESCKRKCRGVYVDIDHDRTEDTVEYTNNNDDLSTELFREYKRYKHGYVDNYHNYFDDIIDKKGEWPYSNHLTTNQTKDGEQKGQFLVVNIYFDTASFDRVTRDAKTNFVEQLSLIGGTLGLFTGFSVLSAIEILFFCVKLIVAICKALYTNKKIIGDIK